MYLSKNLLISLFSIGLIAGCGSDSDSGHLELEEYTLESYDGRSVSSDSLEGTWVAVYNLNKETKYDGRASRSIEAGKVYFIIRETQDELRPLEASVCSGTFTDVTVNGNQIDLTFLRGGMTGDISRNNSISATHDIADHYFFENESLLESIEATVTYDLIKISDATGHLGSYSLEFNEAQIDKNAYCFTQYRYVSEIVGSVSGKGESYKIGANGDIESLELSSVIFDNETSAKASFNTDGISTLDYASEDGDAINYSVNEETDFSHQITYTISGGGNSINGSLSIQLSLN